jgi:molybdate transport system substrate-binding protein
LICFLEYISNIYPNICCIPLLRTERQACCPELLVLFFFVLHQLTDAPVSLVPLYIIKSIGLVPKQPTGPGSMSQQLRVNGGTSMFGPLRRQFLCGLAGIGLLAAIPASAQQVAPAQQAPPASQSQPVLFFAAASLQTALNAIAAEWQKETGKRVTFSYAASSALARQMEQGAPADLFASADLDWMDWSQQRNLIRSETRTTLLGNSLVLIEPSERPVTSLQIAPGFPLSAAIGDSRIATGNPASVPVGKYAQQALTTLGVWDQVSPKIAGADNVRAALALVARGEARFGIVYLTDARTEPKVRVVGTFPANSHPPIVYPFAVTANSKNPDAAAFLAYLSSPAARRVFEAEGFSIQK